MQVGEASWYGFAPGDGLTAAHPWLPFGTVVTVENLENGRAVQVVINDRDHSAGGSSTSPTRPSPGSPPFPKGLSGPTHLVSPAASAART